MKRATSRFDVLTIGAATRDIFVKSSHFENIPSDSAPDGFNACLPLGAKIPIDDLLFETGGGGTNAAVTFARYGFKTTCITRVGQDPDGQTLVEQLKRERIDTRAVQRDPHERTATSIILLAGTGSRAILVARGAAQHIQAHDIPWDKLPARWIYLTSVGGNLPLLKSVFREAKKRRMQLAWNPGNAELDLEFKPLLPFLMQTDLLILNREEAATLANTSPHHLERILTKLGPLPRMALVITDGKRGAHVHARGTTWVALPPKGRIVNTTGAGDAFGSAFCASLMKDDDITHALQIGTLNAHGVVSHMGAKAGILQQFPSARERSRIKVREYR